MPPATLPAPAEVDRELIHRLRLAVGRLARRLRQQAEREITASQFSALASINHLGPITLGRLASVERLRPPTITRIVAALEEAGLVVRRLDPEDRRVARVEIAPEGTQLLQRIRGMKDAYLAARLATLTPEQVAVLRDATAVIERLLEEEGS